VSAARALVALAALAALDFGGCKGEPKAPPPASASGLTTIEIKRGVDACAAFEQQVCEAAKRHADRADLAESCRLAPARRDALKTALEIGTHPETEHRDSLQAQHTVRKISNGCLEETAKLTGL
jgi:hypothetical protein